MTWRTILLAGLVLPGVAFGQSLAPAVSGGPAISGSLHYSVSVSQIMNYAPAVADDLTQSSSLSFAAGYNSESERHPFGLLYSGGGFWTTQAGSNEHHVPESSADTRIYLAQVESEFFRHG